MPTAPGKNRACRCQLSVPGANIIGKGLESNTAPLPCSCTAAISRDKVAVSNWGMSTGITISH